MMMEPTNTCDAPRERELRLALVCYGGVSLAVYMYGITSEILKLVRASRAYHALPENVRATAKYQPRPQSNENHRRLDTEPLYFELLQQIGGTLSLRIVVDVIAGASAGGITGIMLARALAFDLSLDKHKDFWLNLADVTELLDPAAKASNWSKLYMRPLFWVAGLWQRRRARRLGLPEEDPAVLKNLSLFMRSRWFEPPFSGTRMCEMMLDALESLGHETENGNSLVPPGLPLELFVTTTDFWGNRQPIRLHDPPEIQEREHRHILHFRHQQRNSGEFVTDMSADQIPDLAFAARATSSYPGAFPPARLVELDALLKKRDKPWHTRSRFIQDQFAALYRAGEDPEDAAFIDGSVLMNKPISLALQAVQRHVAHRETDRRLVYLEPNPDIKRAFAREVPGFFKTLKGALSDIPRNQPIRDDLEWIDQFNEQVRQQRQVVDAVKPNVLRMIADTLGERLTTAPDANRLRKLRAAANARAAGDAAYAYEGYARLKVISLQREMANLLRKVARLANRTQAQTLIDDWATELGIIPMGHAASDSQWGDEVAWISFLRKFDVRHRLRRVLLLIRRTNELYTEPGMPCNQQSAKWLDEFKTELYLHAESLRERLDWHLLALPEEVDFSSGNLDEVKSLLEMVSLQLDLTGIDRRLDECMASYAASCPQALLARELIIAYLGFAYYDVLTYPMAQSRDLDALEEIKVDRIAVDDANSLRRGGARDILKGVELGNFGAFFSRRFRENDYLWGRLTAAERLIDIVASAVPEAVQAHNIDLLAFKQQLFQRILGAEEPHLREIQDLIDELKRDAHNMRPA